MMHSNVKFAAAALFAAAVVVSGCRCDTGPVNKAEAELAATPQALSFNACPTKDENGQTVNEVYPDEQIFTLSNLGKVAGTVASMEVTGDDPDIKTIFSIPADKKPASVEGSGSVDVPVHFSPTKKGDVRGTLTIDDGLPDTDPVTVSLIGTGINLPSQPTVALGFEEAPGAGTFQACDPSVVSNCLPTWPSTFFNESTVLKFKIKNAGCPTLKITSAEILPNNAQTAVQQAFSFESGFIAPTTETPASLNSADDNSELTFNIRFSPVDETTDVQNPDDGIRYAILNIKTNDPQYPDLSVALSGYGVKPSAYASPSFCNFTDPNDTCGNSSRIQNKAKVSIGNGGGAAIKVQALQFANGGHNGRFTLTGTSAVGQTIAPGTTISQEVSYADLPLFVSDELIIKTTDAVNESMPAGDVRVTFYGGTLPCLSTEPGDSLSFEDPTTTLTTKDVVIKNGAGCGTLIVDDVVVDETNPGTPNPFFSVVDPKIAAGTQVAAGSSVTAKVQFKKPVSGGTQTGVLRIKTNDPAYGPEPYKVVTLYSNAPLNQVPFAVVTGPNGETISMTISKASIPLTNGKKQIQIHGEQSYDPPAGPGSVAQYQFMLVAKPTTANNASLENNGAKVTQSTALLTIDDNATGEYRVALKVYDSSGQPSSNLDVLKVNVNP